MQQDDDAAARSTNADDIERKDQLIDRLERATREACERFGWHLEVLHRTADFYKAKASVYQGAPGSELLGSVLIFLDPSGPREPWKIEPLPGITLPRDYERSLAEKDFFITGLRRCLAETLPEWNASHAAGAGEDKPPAAAFVPDAKAPLLQQSSIKSCLLERLLSIWQVMKSEATAVASRTDASVSAIAKKRWPWSSRIP